jgi:protein-tyrosine phosphatase
MVETLNHGMIDLHCHILPGIDDGPATIEESLELARGAWADGITTIAATPHVDWSHPEVDSTSIAIAVAQLREQLEGAGVRVKIVPGAEVAGTRAIELDDSELRALTIGGSGWLLLECPIVATLAPGFTDLARALAWRGHRILLAHPERSPVFLHAPDLLDELVADGMLAQVTAGALSGRYGRTVRSLALRLVERGSVQVVASDGHGHSRPASIANELARAGIAPSLVAWLAHHVPSALLSGEQLPPRPQSAARRGGRLRRPRL